MNDLNESSCPDLCAVLGTVSQLTRGFMGDMLLDSEEKIRQGARVWYTGCCQ